MQNVFVQTLENVSITFVRKR